MALLPGSPAIDAGAEVEVATDYAGRPRPLGGGYDIGAFEAVIELVTPSGVTEEAPGAH